MAAVPQQQNALGTPSGEPVEEEITFDFEAVISRDEEERQRLLRPADQAAAAAVPAEVAVPRSRATVCRHWIRGMCWKGDNCEFLHQYDTAKMPLCRQFLKTGHCPDRERGTCVFLHERSDNAPICLHYYLGFCRAGPRCRKRHQKLAPQELPLVVPDWYLHLILENAHAVVPHDADPKTEAAIEEVEQKCRQLAAAAATTGPGVSPKLGKAGRRGPPAARPPPSSVLESERAAAAAARRCLVDDTVLELAKTQGIPRLPAATPPRLPSAKVRAFMIKSSDLANIHKSIRLGVWATGKLNTRLLDRVFHEVDHLLLLFSANESGGFQGYARMATPPMPDLHPQLWGSFSARLGSNFRVQWLKQTRVDFEKFGWLTNPLNENQPIRKSRDGQELPVSLAAIICTVLHRQPDEDLLAGTTEEAAPRIDHETFFQLSEPERRMKEAELGIVPPRGGMMYAPPFAKPDFSIHHGPPPFGAISPPPQAFIPMPSVEHGIATVGALVEPPLSAKAALQQRQLQHLQVIKSQPYPPPPPPAQQDAAAAGSLPASYTALRSLPHVLQHLKQGQHTQEAPTK